MVAESGQGYYTPRNILITGGAGFIASHIACELALKYPEYQVSERVVGVFQARGTVQYVQVLRKSSFDQALPLMDRPDLSSNCLLD